MLDGAPPGAATEKSTPILSLAALACEKVEQYLLPADHEWRGGASGGLLVGQGLE
jgi:hypothetical protein